MEKRDSCWDSGAAAPLLPPFQLPTTLLRGHTCSICPNRSGAMSHTRTPMPHTYAHGRWGCVNPAALSRFRMIHATRVTFWFATWATRQRRRGGMYVHGMPLVAAVPSGCTQWAAGFCVVEKIDEMNGLSSGCLRSSLSILDAILIEPRGGVETARRVLYFLSLVDTAVPRYRSNTHQHQPQGCRVHRMCCRCLCFVLHGKAATAGALGSIIWFFACAACAVCRTCVLGRRSVLSRPKQRPQGMSRCSGPSPARVGPAAMPRRQAVW